MRNKRRYIQELMSLRLTLNSAIDCEIEWLLGKGHKTHIDNLEETLHNKIHERFYHIRRMK